MRDIITKLETINEDLGDMAREAEKDHEVQMARADLYKSAKYAVAIHRMLKDVSEMEGIDGWVAAKITKAADYLGSVKHYMEGEMMADVELAVVPVAGDMTDAMTMPEESVEEGFKIRDKSRNYGVSDKTYATRAEAEKARLLKMAETGGDWEVIKEAEIAVESAEAETETTEDTSEDQHLGEEQVSEAMTKVTDIKWDADDEEDVKDLSTTMMVPVPSGMDKEEAEDFIADYITDKTGFTHGGFKIAEAEQVEEEDVIGDIIAKLPPTKPRATTYTQADRDRMNDLINKAMGKTKPKAMAKPAATMSAVTQQKQANQAAKMQTQSKFSEWGKK